MIVKRLATKDIVISDKTGKSKVVDELNALVQKQNPHTPLLLPVDVGRMIVQNEVWVAEEGGVILAACLLVVYQTFEGEVVEPRGFYHATGGKLESDAERMLLGTLAERTRELLEKANS